MRKMGKYTLDKTWGRQEKGVVKLGIKYNMDLLDKGLECYTRNGQFP